MDVDCLLIADDLTGACDAAVQFTMRGLAASVMLEMDEPPAGARVVAVSTESRHLAEREIPPVMARVAERYRGAVVFKKIDSVLRGNPGVEIAAALEAFGCEAAVATPAFPAMGRLVRGGRLSIGDVDVAAVLRSDAHVAPECVATASGRVISADAASDADLDCIVAQAMSTRGRVLWAGSAGLAGALARRWGGAAGEAPSPAMKRVLFCIGSDHPGDARANRRASARQARVHHTDTGGVRLHAGCPAALGRRHGVGDLPAGGRAAHRPVRRGVARHPMGHAARWAFRRGPGSHQVRRIRRA